MINSGIITQIQRFSTGDGPGIRSTVFLKGCNLHCKWCHNPETLSPQKKQRMFYANLCRQCGKCGEGEVCPNGALEYVGYEITPSETARILLEDKPFYEHSSGGVTFSGGEPLLQKEYVQHTAQILKKEKIHIAVDTAAAVPYTAFELLNPVTDLYLIDLKGIDETLFYEKTGGSLALVLENIKNLTESGKEILLRVIVVPGYSDTDEYMKKIDALAGALHLQRITLLPFHNMGAPKYRALGLEYEYQNTPPVERSLLEKLSRNFTNKTIE